MKRNSFYGNVAIITILTLRHSLVGFFRYQAICGNIASLDFQRLHAFDRNLKNSIMLSPLKRQVANEGNKTLLAQTCSVAV